jgi:hypothetical protein
VDIAVAPGGYWLVTAAGSVHPFGRVPTFEPVRSEVLAAPVVAAICSS